MGFGGFYYFCVFFKGTSLKVDNRESIEGWKKLQLRKDWIEEGLGAANIRCQACFTIRM